MCVFVFVFRFPLLSNVSHNLEWRLHELKKENSQRKRKEKKKNGIHKNWKWNRAACSLCCTSKNVQTKMKTAKERANSHNKFQRKRYFFCFLLSSAIFHKQWHTFNAHHTHTVAKRKVCAQFFGCLWPFISIANVPNQNTSKTANTHANDVAR